MPASSTGRGSIIPTRTCCRKEQAQAQPFRQRGKSDEDYKSFGNEFVFGSEADLKKIRIKSIFAADCPDECFVSFSSVKPKAVIYKNIYTDELKTKQIFENVMHKDDEEDLEKLKTELKKLRIEIEKLKNEILKLEKKNTD